MHAPTEHVPFLSFWGKAQAREEATHQWHPVAYHLLDVAATADEIVRVRPLALRAGARLLGTSEADAHRLLAAVTPSLPSA